MDFNIIKNQNNQNRSDSKNNKWYGILYGNLGHRPAYAGNAETKGLAVGLLDKEEKNENNISRKIFLGGGWKPFLTAEKSHLKAKASVICTLY